MTKIEDQQADAQFAIEQNPELFAAYRRFLSEYREICKAAADASMIAFVAGYDAGRCNVT